MILKIQIDELLILENQVKTLYENKIDLQLQDHNNIKFYQEI